MPRVLIIVVVLAGAVLVARAQQPPNCETGGFVISPDETIWVCKGMGQPAEQVATGGAASWGAITGTLADQTDLQTALDGKQVAGTYATGTGSASGTNTGDQTSIVGITGTLTEFNTALTGADFATGGGTATGTNTGDQTSVSGNAGTATALQTARTINGVSFNGTANITVPAAGSTLTDAVTVEKGGTGQTAFGTSLQVLRTNAAATATEWATLAGGSEAFPVGSVFISVVSTNPATLLGYGTWSAFAAGRVLVSLDAGDPDFDTVEETGGAKTHTLTTTEIPAHTHSLDDLLARSSASGGQSSQVNAIADTSATLRTPYVSETTGGGGAHNIVQPYIVVYMWKRTS